MNRLIDSPRRQSYSTPSIDKRNATQRQVGVMRGEVFVRPEMLPTMDEQVVGMDVLPGGKFRLLSSA